MVTSKAAFYPAYRGWGPGLRRCVRRDKPSGERRFVYSPVSPRRDL